MVTYTFTNGTNADALEVNKNFTDLMRYFGVLCAQNAYQTLQANNVFDIKGFLTADEYVDSNGTNNTKTGGTMLYDADADGFKLGYTDEASGDTTTTSGTNTGSWTNQANAFDNDDGTAATNNSSTADHSSSVKVLGKTFSAKYIGWIKFKYSVTGDDANTTTRGKIQTFDGATWNDVSGSGGNAQNTTTTINTSLLVDDTIQGIRFYCDVSGSFSTVFNVSLHTLEYGDYNSSETLITDSGLTLDGTENTFGLFLDATNTANTSIAITATDGTTTTSSQAVTDSNVIIDISSLSSGSLSFTLTGSTTDTSETPLIKGYGGCLLK